MKKLLWYSDFLVPTGFGNVAEELIDRLLATGEYEIDVVAINYNGDPIKLDSPYAKYIDKVHVYPAASYGDADIWNMGKVLGLLATG